MVKIIKLDKILANQIAAGEVVERPVSIVKELVENSIDSKADNIIIEIKGWWIEEINISDNWIGIEKDDLFIIWEKHSTSKIKSLDDLYNVLTFWFRWEAIASISSVSDLEIITKSKNDSFWNKVEFNSGKRSEVMQASKDSWTSIIVKNLFHNTPARLNYLKTPKTEYNHILNYLYEAALAYPEIAFEFISDWKNIFTFKKNEDLKTRIYNIYWDFFSSNLLDINFEFSWMKISWYISDPKISFANKSRQNLFVNRRPIKSYMISRAINDAFSRFISPSTNPWYVLYLEVDPTTIDVNVHPRKLEVRFENEQSIFRAFYHAINDRLNSVSLIGANTENLTNVNLEKNIEHQNEDSKKYYTGSGTKFKDYSPYKNIEFNPKQKNIQDAISFSKELLTEDKINTHLSLDNLSNSNDLHFTKLWKILWQAHNSYIIVETEQWIKFLDQHALAERIIFEKIKKNDKKNSIQQLLFAESFNITPIEADFLLDNIDIFKDIWFDLELLSWNILIINSIPDFIKKENLSEIFLWILEDISNFWFKKSNTLDEVKNKIYAYTACRSAIKFWNKLSLFEMNKLLNDSVEWYTSTCPHWRPVVFEISLDELKDKYER